jgi:hypothetical protein
MLGLTIPPATPDSPERESAPQTTAAVQPHLLLVSGTLALLRGHYENVIRGLTEQGVRVTIRYIRDGGFTIEEYRETLRNAGIDADVAPLERAKLAPGEKLSLRLRELGNILRYTHPDYVGRDALTTRAILKKGAMAQRWGRWILRLGPGPASRIARVVAWVEATLPAPRHALDLVDRERPTAIAVVPVIRVPALVDFLKAGAERRIPTAIWVQSWDNLTNKGLLHFEPDRVFVWNDRQKEELARYHGVGPERVSTTGAQTFDHWFGDAEPEAREAFCEQLGVDPGRPIILYLSSSPQIAPEEPAFFERWLAAVRSSSDEVLASATVLVRPHPSMIAKWTDIGIEDLPGVVMSPTTRKDRLNSEGFRQQYRNELHHATVAFGINTSGVIDAAIFGKPACTIELPELYLGQRGTVHFEHLARPGDGLLRLSTTFEEHAALLAELIHRDTYASDEQSMAFVRMFVRPHGLDATPADVFVAEMLPLSRSSTVVELPGAVLRSVGQVLSASAAVTLLPSKTKHGTRRARKLGRIGARRTRALGRIGVRRTRKVVRIGARRSRDLALQTARRVLPRPVRRLVRRALGMPPSTADADTADARAGAAKP